MISLIINNRMKRTATNHSFIDLTISFVLIAYTLYFVSCKDSEELPPNSSSAQISFVPEVNREWIPAIESRSADKANVPSMPENSMITMQTRNGETYYLHIEYANHMESSADMPVNGEAGTRATPITSGNMYDSFGILAYNYANSGNWGNGMGKKPDHMYNVKVEKKSGTSWMPTATYYWPGAGKKVSFFAYAPYNETPSDPDFTLSDQGFLGEPTIQYTVPEKVADQKDLLVAKAIDVPGNKFTPQDINFYHALTAVKFVTGSGMNGVTVNKITLKNIFSQGTHYMGTAGWSVNTLKDFSHVFNSKPLGENLDLPVNKPEETFMMIPQTLSTEAKIEIEFKGADNFLDTLTANITGKWPMGKVVTYRISNNSSDWEYTLEVTDPGEFSHEGNETKQYGVTSYKKKKNSERILPVKWDVVGYKEDGEYEWKTTKPAWLTTFTTSAGGSVDRTNYDITVAEQTFIETITDHNTILKNSTPKGNSASDPYNLSTSLTDGCTNVKNSANCYIVDAPGHYAFPLIYGNAIKEGIVNSRAYTSTVGGGTPPSSILSPFINHLGVGITDPYVMDNGIIPSSAELVWQDETNLVTNIQYNHALYNNKGGITFEVTKASIKQGNAVIAVKDDEGVVLWSWHIWVTTADSGTHVTIKNSENKKYNFLSSPAIGWCYSNSYKEIKYPARGCQVKFKNGGNVEKIITIQQKTKTEITGLNGSAPFYQWGRKDPFQATGNVSAANWSTGDACIVNGIRNPNTMNTNNAMDYQYYNLWSADNNETSLNDAFVIKTVYDPSPLGYCLPSPYAFSPFSSSSRFWNSAEKGWFLNRTSNAEDGIIYFPTAGWRYNAVLYDVGAVGFFWSSGPLNNQDARHSGMDTSNMYPFTYYFRACGFHIRPVKE